jgi:predicted GNAT family acetyltransferase
MVEQTNGQIRRLTAEDVPAALGLSTEAGWNQTADDWRMLIELAPETCLAIDVEGELAATTTVICYGQKLAWIGMVLTRMKFRGRGLARQLLSHSLLLADQMKIATLKLDATDQGKPLYEKSGFRFEQPVERWSRTAMDGMTKAASAKVSRKVSGVNDSEAFGADRSSLLKRLAQRNPASSSSNAFLLTRAGRTTSYLGPCVSDDEREARALIEFCVHNTTTAISWDILLQNQKAAVIAKDLGFAPRRHLTRMVRGKDLRGKEESIFAIAGFELG